MSGKGRLYGVGVGPGDPELLTLKAVRILGSCGTLAVPGRSLEKCAALRIAAGAVPEVLDKPVLFLDMPMTRDREARERACAAAADKLEAVLAEGRDVAFLTLGDPSVYSTFGYLRGRIVRAGYEAETVPGVTSFCAAAAALGEPLCLDSEPLHIIPGSAENFCSGTRVYMKGGARGLPRMPEDHDGPVFAASDVGMETQRLYRPGDEIPEDTGYFTLIIAKEKEA